MTHPRQLNGRACPECGAEMYDSWPGVRYDSNPPQKSVHCDCGFHDLDKVDAALSRFKAFERRLPVTQRRDAARPRRRDRRR